MQRKRLKIKNKNSSRTGLSLEFFYQHWLTICDYITSCQLFVPLQYKKKPVLPDDGNNIFLFRVLLIHSFNRRTSSLFLGRLDKGTQVYNFLLNDHWCSLKINGSKLTELFLIQHVAATDVQLAPVSTDAHYNSV